MPSDARDALPLHHNETVLAAGRLVDGSWVAATRLALLLPGQRVEWEAVAHADWSADASLSLEQLATAHTGPQTHRLVLDEPGRLPEVVRERVTASIVASRHLPVQGTSGVRVVARRVPGQDELRQRRILSPWP